MAVYIVTYDLHQQGQNYECIREKLESYGAYWHAQGSVWFVSTSQSALQVLNSLKGCLDGNDKIFVAKLEGEAAWVGYPQDVTDWLQGLLGR